MADADPTSDYSQLREAVDRVLPVDGAGRRRPPAREAARTYWEIGRLLNHHISGRAAYGQRAVARLAEDLGVLPRTLYRARKLHQRLPEDTLALQRLTWSHCRLLVTVDDDVELQQLMSRAADEGWSVRRLQECLRGPSTGEAPARGRPATYRLVTVVAPDDESPALAFDLGFGVRRPLSALGKIGKRTRRLVGELADGDVVELTRDHKGRPALRRVWGQVEARLYTYPAALLDAPGPGVVRALLVLGLGVRLERRLRLRGVAGRLDPEQLLSRLTHAPSLVVIRTHRVGPDYDADLYGLPDERDARVIAERGDYLNAAWTSRG